MFTRHKDDVCERCEKADPSTRHHDEIGQMLCSACLSETHEEQEAHTQALRDAEIERRIDEALMARGRR